VDALPHGVSLLVNNAGITRDRSTVNMSDDEWDSVLTLEFDRVPCKWSIY